MFSHPSNHSRYTSILTERRWKGKGNFHLRHCALARCHLQEAINDGKMTLVWRSFRLEEVPIRPWEYVRIIHQ